MDNKNEAIANLVINQTFFINCPHCGFENEFKDTESIEKFNNLYNTMLDASYLTIKCLKCKKEIEVVGFSEED